MFDGLTALVGVHDKDSIPALDTAFQLCEHKVTVARTHEEMLRLAKEQFTCYLMDLNFGSPNSPDVTPAEQVYDLVKERVGSGRSVFMGISNNMQAVALARTKGIPAEDKGDFSVHRWLGA